MQKKTQALRFSGGGSFVFWGGFFDDQFLVRQYVSK